MLVPPGRSTVISSLAYPVCADNSNAAVSRPIVPFSFYTSFFKLEFNPGDDLLCATLTGADDVRNRIRAGQELIKSGTRANLAAVRAAMAAEPFWGVRAALAKALGECGHAAAIPVLAERLLSEEEPRAKQVLAAACGGLRDRRLAAALRDFIARPQAPLAHSTALLSLGAQRDEADRALLVSRASLVGSARLINSPGAWGMANILRRRVWRQWKVMASRRSVLAGKSALRLSSG
jgi:hypothetical protein